MLKRLLVLVILLVSPKVFAFTLTEPTNDSARALLQPQDNSCGISESSQNGQDCFQLPGSTGSICYAQICGCGVYESDLGCAITCSDPSCQGQ